MSTDRNLLFGILAVQMDFVSRDALIAAMSGWVLAKHRPLGEILVEQEALSAANRDLLEALVSAHIRHQMEVRIGHGGETKTGVLRPQSTLIGRNAFPRISRVREPARPGPRKPTR